MHGDIPLMDDKNATLLTFRCSWCPLRLQ